MAVSIAAAPSTATGLVLPRLRHLIAGGFVDEPAARSLAVIDPATGESLGEVPLAGASEVRRAVQAARAAQADWAEVAVQQRARALFAVRDVLDRHREHLAGLVSRDMGKTFVDAFAEVGRGIESVEAAAGAPHLLKGQTLEQVAGGVDVESVRQPVGVVAAISPFNFPAMIPLWFIPYALAAGNAVVLKPSEQDPFTPQRIVELIDGLDVLPPGTLSLVHGAHDAVNALLRDPGVDAVSFVGSARTARYVASTAVAEGKRVQALGGAKNTMVVMPDADQAVVAEQVGASAFGAAGQRCLAGSVLALVGSREEQDRSLQTVVDHARELVVGPGGDSGTDVCPVISPGSRSRLIDAIETAETEGASVLLDGRGEAGPAETLLGPTVIDDLDPESEAAREELFGPVLSVLRFETLDAAVAWSNAGRYGNSAIVFTTSGAAARRFRRSIHAGMLGVNVGVAAPVAWFPFAGWGDSIDGDLHANGDDAFAFYTRQKVVTSRW